MKKFQKHKKYVYFNKSLACQKCFDTSGLLATWPEFWAIGLSFLDTFAFSLDTLLAHSAPPPP